MYEARVAGTDPRENTTSGRKKLFVPCVHAVEAPDRIGCGAIEFRVPARRGGTNNSAMRHGAGMRRATQLDPDRCGSTTSTPVGGSEHCTAARDIATAATWRGWIRASIATDPNSAAPKRLRLRIAGEDRGTLGEKPVNLGPLSGIKAQNLSLEAGDDLLTLGQPFTASLGDNHGMAPTVVGQPSAFKKALRLEFVEEGDRSRRVDPQRPRQV